eukprot:9622804-Karenia_brevis.AAC.1
MQNLGWDDAPEEIEETARATLAQIGVDEQSWSAVSATSRYKVVGGSVVQKWSSVTNCKVQ